MKTGSFFSDFYSALILKVVGVVLILGTLLDYIILVVPPDFLNSEWLAQLINEWVSRASVPLLGLALLFWGVWFDRDSESGFKVLPKIALGLSALLGVVFLILAPLYFNSSRLTSAAQTRQINQQAAQAEQQLNNLLEQQRARVSAIVSNEDQLAQLQQRLDSLDLSAEQQAQLKQIRTTLDKVKSDPKALDQEVAKARTEGINQIKQKQTEALDELQSELRRDRLHTTLSSLMFSIGYLMIAWIGLSGGSKTPRVKKRR
jgi:ABC-type multidrug transport system fused ATPase/permease subunit